MEHLIELSNPYEAVWINTPYGRGEIPPRYPVPVKLDWNGLPPPDLVRLTTGGMYHHSAERYNNRLSVLNLI